MAPDSTLAPPPPTLPRPGLDRGPKPGLPKQPGPGTQSSVRGACPSPADSI